MAFICGYWEIEFTSWLCVFLFLADHFAISIQFSNDSYHNTVLYLFNYHLTWFCFPSSYNIDWANKIAFPSIFGASLRDFANATICRGTDAEVTFSTTSVWKMTSLRLNSTTTEWPFSVNLAISQQESLGKNAKCANTEQCGSRKAC